MASTSRALVHTYKDKSFKCWANFDSISKLEAILSRWIYLQSLLQPVVIVRLEEGVNTGRFVATEQLNIALHHMLGKGIILLCLSPEK